MLNKLSLYEFKRRALSVLFPNLCPFCGRLIEAEKYYCEACGGLLPRIRKQPAPPDNVSGFYACCWYSGIARSAVHMLKFGSLIYPADAFGLMMSEMLRGVEADALVPVPSGINSIEKRGFSPAEVIAERISMRLDIPIENALAARADKAEQKTLSRKKRAINAKKSFYIADDADITGKRLLLIDDVTTTGSTLSALAEMLLDNGSVEVSAAVFAKVPGDFVRPNKPRVYKRRTARKGQ